MNSKIKNYVDVLFNDVPNTRKACELKEEILSNLNEHYEEYIAEGKSENQAYTSALSALGDIDELLAGIAPEKETQERINEYRKIRARRMSIALALYSIGLIALIGCMSTGYYVARDIKSILTIVGIVSFVAFFCGASGVLLYTSLSIPQDIEPFLAKKECSSDSSTGRRIYESFMSMYWIYITVIYFAVSFATGAWHVTWLIWLASPAIFNSLKIFFGSDKKNNDE